MNAPAQRLAGKVAVVTGGSSGIGRAIAEVFAANGARVHIMARNADAARAVATEIGNTTAHACDVTSREQVDAAFREILSREPIDILVNNAGRTQVGTAENTSEEDFDALYQLNVKGAYYCIRAVISGMKARRAGVILNVASITASSGLPDRYAYSMTKGALLGMTYSVARDYVKDGIRCLAISPARIHTPMLDAMMKERYPGREKEIFDKLTATQPVGRMGTPREVADLALYLCSDEARFVTGVDYPIDGGFFKLHD